MSDLVALLRRADPEEFWTGHGGLFERAADEIERLRHALAFYADERRYQGPNQRPLPNDPYSPPDQSYIWDTTKDWGEIARRATNPIVKQSAP